MLIKAVRKPLYFISIPRSFLAFLSYADVNWLPGSASYGGRQEQSQNTYKIGKMTKYFFGFAKYFSRFSDNSWICKFVWNLQNNICGFNNFIKICNSFSD